MYEDPFADREFYNPNNFFGYKQMNDRALGTVGAPADPFWDSITRSGAVTGGQTQGQVFAPDTGAQTFQQAAIQDLHSVASGRTHPAVDALRRGTQQAQGLAAAAGAAQRGRGAGAALRNIGADQAQIGALGRAQAGLVSLQEQQAAQQALMQLLQGVRSQDLAQASQTAGGLMDARSSDDQFRQGMLGVGAGRAAGLGQYGLNKARVSAGLVRGDMQLQDQFWRMLAQGGASALDAYSATGGSRGQDDR
jgi:hypothetical protein